MKRDAHTYTGADAVAAGLGWQAADSGLTCISIRRGPGLSPFGGYGARWGFARTVCPLSNTG